jgi:hypothetical protein
VSPRSRPRQRRSTDFGWRWSQAAGDQAGLGASAEAVGSGARFRVGASRFLRRLVKDYGRLPATVAGLHFERFGEPLSPPSDPRARVASITPSSFVQSVAILLRLAEIVSPASLLFSTSTSHLPQFTATTVRVGMFMAGVQDSRKLETPLTFRSSRSPLCLAP